MQILTYVACQNLNILNNHQESRPCPALSLPETSGIQQMICPKKVGGRVCKYMRAGAIHIALTQCRTVQKGGSNLPNPRQITPCRHHIRTSNLILIHSFSQPVTQNTSYLDC